MVALIDAFAEPLNDTEPVTSPVSSIVRDVARVVAVSAFPVTLPISGAVTAANCTEAEVPTACPIATVGEEPSPGVCVTVTPVPAVKSLT